MKTHSEKKTSQHCDPLSADHVSSGVQQEIFLSCNAAAESYILAPELCKFSHLVWLAILC